PRGPAAPPATGAGRRAGTLHPRAPGWAGGAPASKASDLYALGCLLYECLAGAPPFAGRGEAEIGYAHLVEPPLDPCPDRPELSAAVLTALAKDPRARPTTATALARMLHLAGTRAPV